MMRDEITEQVLLAQAGDREAYGRLVEQFQPTVYAVALKKMRNPTEAQELTQEVFVHAMRKLAQIRDVRSFPGWIKTIAKRMAINRLTRRGPIQKVEDGFLDNTAAAGVTPLESLIQAEQAGELHRALDLLKPVDRATLVAFYLRGRTLIQMGREFEVPIGTIKRRLHVARNRLKEVLEGLAGDAVLAGEEFSDV
jgi:RNA polymerase sigma-70 factor (ECF subfamily)